MFKFKKLLVGLVLGVFVFAPLFSSPSLAAITVIPAPAKALPKVKVITPAPAKAKALGASVKASLFDANISAALKNSVQKKISIPGRKLLKNKIVKIKLASLKETVAGKLRLKSRVPLDLFDDARFTAVLSKIEETSAGKFVASGALAEVPGSFVTLVSKGNILVANIHTPTKIYEIRYLGNGLHTVNQIDPSSFPPDDNITSSAPVAITSKPASPATVEVNVMVAYTAQARDAAGGTDAIRDLIDLSVAETNMAYENSKIWQRVKLVKTAEVDYQESGYFEEDLMRLSAETDQHMDAIHRLRRLYQADLVSLFVSDANGYGESKWCGLGNQLNSVNIADFTPSGFNVVKLGCLSNYTFTHELGHNMGAGHEEANAGPSGLYDDSHGYWDPEYSFRTIMAYDCPVSCVRLPYFSNPNVEYDDKATGVEYAADNARTLNNTKEMVIQFRPNLRPGEELEESAGEQSESSSGDMTLGASASLALTEYTQTVGATGGNPSFVALGNDRNSAYVGEYFTANNPRAGATTRLKGVSFKALKKGNPPFLIKVGLRNKGDSSDATPLVMSSVAREAIKGGTAISDEHWVRLNFREPITIDNGSEYFFVLYATATHAKNYYVVGTTHRTSAGGQMVRRDTIQQFDDLTVKFHYAVSLVY